jgi:hypothetical protein
MDGTTRECALAVTIGGTLKATVRGAEKKYESNLK